MTKGEFVYDHGDTAGMTPLLAMYSLGHAYVPPAIHAGGLRYHGMAPLVCAGLVEGLIEATSINQLKCYKAAMTWAQTEGTICAPETSHAIRLHHRRSRAAPAKKARNASSSSTTAATALMDLSGYDAYLSGKLKDSSLSDEEIQKSMKSLAGMPMPHKNKTGKW